MPHRPRASWPGRLRGNKSRFHLALYRDNQSPAALVVVISIVIMRAIGNLAILRRRLRDLATFEAIYNVGL